MDIKRYCFSFVAVFAFIFLSDYLCHEFLLAEMYEKTRELWRAKDEHIMIFIWLDINNLLAYFSSRKKHAGHCMG